MSVSMEKGQKVSLNKEAPGVRAIQVGLGWDLSKFENVEFDLDAEVFLLDRNGKVPSDDHFIFYNNKKSKNGAVEHMGDNRQGGSTDEYGRKRDDEIINVELTRVEDGIERLAFTVSIYKAEERRQNFGMVRNAYIRVTDVNSQNEICRYDLSEDFSSETAVIFGEVYRHNGEWRFGAIGQGYSGGLRPLAISFGVDVA